MYEQLYLNILNSLCSITVYLDGECISEGSGFAISEDGAVLTAAHVLTARTPILERDYTDPGMRIVVKFANIDAIEYSVGICAINIPPRPGSELVQIDQALIFPRTPLSTPLRPLTLGPAPRLGEEVFFGGYSDELQLPLQIDALVATEAPDITFGVSVRRGHNSDITGPIIKRGVVGNFLNTVTENAATGIQIECAVFYLDNGIHSGASGGPIVNRAGLAVGVIVQRAVTNASQSSAIGLEVPSGSTVGLSCAHTVPAMYQRLGSIRTI